MNASLGLDALIFRQRVGVREMSCKGGGGEPGTRRSIDLLQDVPPPSSAQHACSGGFSCGMTDTRKESMCSAIDAVEVYDVPCAMCYVVCSLSSDRRKLFPQSWAHDVKRLQCTHSFAWTRQSKRCLDAQQSAVEKSIYVEAIDGIGGCGECRDLA